MSVDFFECDACGRTVCECGPHKRCQSDYGCGRKWCNRKCAEVDGADEDYICKYCRDEDIEDSPLLHFLLGHFGLTIEKAKEMYFEANPPQDDD